jgi:hypothetical protein
LENPKEKTWKAQKKNKYRPASGCDLYLIMRLTVVNLNVPADYVVPAPNRDFPYDVITKSKYPVNYSTKFSKLALYQ